jgi:site-specific DNA-cytosine methylase
LKIAVLFDGAGLARKGLELAGHECTGYELDEYKHQLSLHLCEGESKNMDVLDIDPKELEQYDAIWASPPCQEISVARVNSQSQRKATSSLLQWSLALKSEVLWVENVTGWKPQDNEWGTVYNAAQFTDPPLQNRNRVIGGRYTPPNVLHQYKRVFDEAMPCVLATEYKGQHRRAGRAFGRTIELEEAAYLQGIDEIPGAWFDVPSGFTKSEWNKVLYEAIGNGVPVYMAEAFGNAA